MPEEHKFWQTQPVDIKNKSPVSEENLQIPAEFLLEEFKETDIDAVVEFLRNNYVRDLHSKFRLEYTKSFIQWQLNSPKGKKEYTLCLKKQNEIYGFIHGRHMKFKVEDEILDLAMINFLCLHKNLRNNRLAPVLITEIRKRFNKNGIEKAFFTSGLELPFKFSSAQYFHYLINVEKLENIGFCKNLKTTYRPKIRENIRLLQKSDLPQLLDLYKKEIEKFKFAEIHDLETLEYTFYPRDEILTTLVYEKDGNIIEFGTIIRVDTAEISTGRNIKTAYLYCYNSKEIISDLIAYSEINHFDVFNCISIMKNNEIIDNFDFYIGTGQLNFYMFNHKVKGIREQEIFYYLP